MPVERDVQVKGEIMKYEVCLSRVRKVCPLLHPLTVPYTVLLALTSLASTAAGVTYVGLLGPSSAPWPATFIACQPHVRHCVGYSWYKNELDPDPDPQKPMV
jgi:hypothetical protein